MNRLRLWRLQNQLTQGQAAARLGIGQSTLALLEKDRLRPTPAQLETLRLTFGEGVETLFYPVQERVEGIV
jgi:transcriptional regulator with XRE-family HTH domain